MGRGDGANAILFGDGGAMTVRSLPQPDLPHLRGHERGQPLYIDFIFDDVLADRVQLLSAADAEGERIVADLRAYSALISETRASGGIKIVVEPHFLTRWRDWLRQPTGAGVPQAELDARTVLAKLLENMGEEISAYHPR
jgi:hypothetical protein